MLYNYKDQIYAKLISLITNKLNFTSYIKKTAKITIYINFYFKKKNKLLSNSVNANSNVIIKVLVITVTLNTSKGNKNF